MVFLRYVALLALVIWDGGLVALGAIAAPAIFAVIGARQVPDGRLLAGAVFGEVLRRFFFVSCGAAAVVFLTLIVRRILGPKPRHAGARAAILALMTAATLYAGIVVSGQIAAVQASIGAAPSSLPDTDPRRIEFGRLHGLSSALQLVLIFWELKE
jgi:hypothetical protein